jgi:hypothetical protein
LIATELAEDLCVSRSDERLPDEVATSTAARIHRRGGGDPGEDVEPPVELPSS